MVQRLATILIAVLAALTLPARSPAEAPDEKPATATPITAAAKAVALAKRLAQPVDLQPVQNETLEALLKRLARQHHLNLWIDTWEFHPQLLEEPEDLPPLRAIPLDCLFRRLLRRAGGDFILRDGIIEVTTLARIQDEFYRDDLPPVIGAKRAAGDSEQEEDPIPPWRAENFPLAQLDVENRPLRAVLQELSEAARCNVLVSQDPQAETRVSAHFTNVPLDSAVVLLADLAGLKVTWLDHVLYVGHPTVGKQPTWLVE